MRLFELDTLPETAGQAVLQFKSEAKTPVREEEVISIPQAAWVEYFPLENHEQFLLHVNRSTGSELYFGGTDERPFLTQLDNKAFAPFATGGQEGLFEALKPELIRQLEAGHGPEHTIRQGDIFAYPVFDGDERLTDWWKFANWLLADNEEVKITRREMRIFNTRHTLTGDAIFMAQTRVNYVTGVLEAPDHAPRELSGPHYIAQSALLFDPPNAD